MKPAPERLPHIPWSKFLKAHREEIAGIAPVPNGLWMSQVARNLIDEFSGFLRGNGYLIHDRDPLYTRNFRALLTTAGVRPVRLLPHYREVA